MVNDQSTKPIVGITMGDPAGIGPEICLHALAEKEIIEECIPLVFGDADVLKRIAEICTLPVPEKILSLAEWKANPTTQVPTVVDCEAVDGKTVEPGVVSKACGHAAFTYIITAIEAALRGEFITVTTGPIHKEALNLAEVPFPGHTEIFASYTKADRACMMLTSNEITTSFVTTHIGLVDVPTSMPEKRVLDVIELTADAMTKLRGKAPRIVVCGLNPHAGENGLFGKQEEEHFIEPAITVAKKKGINIIGPIPPDTAFVASVRKETDAYVCMYHDQGHIPFKMLAFEDGVNITLGLPIIRTSVDHGTAFDIAWTRKASPTSLYQAIRYGARLASGETVEG